MYQVMTKKDEKAMERRGRDLEQLRRLGSIDRLLYHPTLRTRLGKRVLTVRPEYHYYDLRTGRYTAEFMPTGDVKENMVRWLVCRNMHLLMLEIRL